MSPEIAYIVPVVFLASFARASLGFGDGLLAMPLLTLFLPPRTAAPLVALTATTTAAGVLCRQWKQVHFRAATQITIASLIAVPLGVAFLHFGHERLAKSLLALTILSFSVWSLRRDHWLQLDNDRWSPVFGFAAGLLSGAYNTGGPPVVIYGTLRRWEPDKFRATLQSYTMVAAAWVVTMHAVSGLTTRRVLVDYVCCLPAVGLAVVIGPLTTRRLRTEAFIRMVFWSLLVIGTWLLISAVFDVTPIHSQEADTTASTHGDTDAPPV